MFKLFYSPVEAVEEAMDKSLGMVILFLLGASILAGVSALLLMIGGGAKLMLLTGLVTLVAVFIGTLIGALILTATLNMIKAEGIEYKLGLTACTIGLIVPSVAVLAGILLSYIPYIGEILATIVIFIGTLMGFSEYFRALITYFETDYVVVFTAFYVVTVAAIVSANFGVVRTLLGFMGMFLG